MQKLLDYLESIGEYLLLALGALVILWFVCQFIPGANAAGCIKKTVTGYTSVPCVAQPQVAAPSTGAVVHGAHPDLQAQLIAADRANNPCYGKHCCDQSHRDYGRACTAQEQRAYMDAVNKCVAAKPLPEKSWANVNDVERGGCM
jgi:hypothetical protein